MIVVLSANGCPLVPIPNMAWSSFTSHVVKRVSLGTGVMSATLAPEAG